MSKEKQHLIDDIMTNETICVLATLQDHAPYTSLMTYFPDHAGMKFYFLTRSTSQKYKNLKKNPHVSLLIDRRRENISLSITGHYRPIRKRQTAEAILRLYLMAHPELKEFADHPETVLIRIQGTAARLAEGKSSVFDMKLKNS